MSAAAHDAERQPWQLQSSAGEELGVLEALLDTRAAGAGPTAVALEGEAGIGKSTLWREAVAAARARELRVLTARAAETECNFAYAGLGDLLDGLLPEVLPALTPPQRRALEVTLLGRRRDGSACGSARARCRRTERAAAACRGRARAGDRRPPVARRAVCARARVRRASAAGNAPAADLDASARGSAHALAVGGGARGGPSCTASTGGIAERRSAAPNRREPLREGAAEADAASVARSLRWEPVLRPRAGPRARLRGWWA